MQKKLLMLTIFVLPFLFTSFSYAHEGKAYNAHGSYCKMDMKKMLESLNLSQEQKAKIKEIKQNVAKMKDEDKQALADNDKKIKELIVSDNLDENALGNLVQQKMDVIGKLIKAEIKAKNDMFKVLDAKQQEKFKEIVKKWICDMKDKQES